MYRFYDRCALERSLAELVSCYANFAQRLSNPRTLTHTGMPKPIQLSTSHAPSPNSALNSPVTLTSPIADLGGSGLARDGIDAF